MPAWIVHYLPSKINCDKVPVSSQPINSIATVCCKWLIKISIHSWHEDSIKHHSRVMKFKQHKRKEHPSL